MPETLVDELNAASGWVKDMGIVILTASPDEVTCEWEVSGKHHQPYGIVHGGVHCGVIETLASIGAAMVAQPRGSTWSGGERHLVHPRGALRQAACRGPARHPWAHDPVVGGVDPRRQGPARERRVRLLCVDESKALG